MALLHAIVDVAADALGDVELGEMFPAPLDQLRQALLDVQGLEQPELLLVGQVGRVARHIGQLARFGDALDRVDDLPSAPLLKDRDDDVAVLTAELARGLAAGDLVEYLGVDPECRSRPGHSGADTCAAHGAEHGSGLAAGQLAQLLDGRDDADQGVLAVEPRHDQDLVAASHAGRVDGRLPLGVVEGDRHDHAGQNDDVSQREHRELLSL